jgi:Na+(H+)/acetate symporter ActP
MLGTLLTAGAFAAFLSTASGLTVSVAGVLGQELGRLRGGTRARGVLRTPPAALSAAMARTRRAEARAEPRTEARGDVLRLRLAGVAAASVPCLLSLVAVERAAADTVGLAFAVAASSFSPLLLLGIWWRGLTAQGATAGLLVGGGATLGAVAAAMLGDPGGGWIGTLVSRPAAWSVPLAFAAMIGVSLLTRGSIPPGTGRALVRLHAPESLALPPRAGRTSGH